MKKEDIKNSINRTIENVIPSDFNIITSKIKNKEGVILKMENSNKKMPSLALSLSLSLVVLFVAYLGISTLLTKQVYASINFDINPSIELVVNKKLKVLRANTYNVDGEKIIGDMNLEGSKLNVATNAIVGSMLKNGYINDVTNSVLVSVDGNNETISNKIKDDVASEINEIIEDYNINGSVITQIVHKSNELKELAEEYNATIGKVRLIQKIVDNNNLYKFEDLVKLNVNELNLLINSNQINLDIKTSGDASDKAYIGKTRAMDIALDDIKVTNSNITNVEIDMDIENGIMVYDVEFDYGTSEYDYEINATTGVIVNKKVESNTTDFDDDDDDDNKSGKISRVRAKEIALQHAKINNIIDYDIEFEYLAGVGVYSIEFETTSKEYKYIINADTGSIVKNSVEDNNDIDDDDDED